MRRNERGRKKARESKAEREGNIEKGNKNGGKAKIWI